MEFQFERLEVWQKSKQLVMNTYRMLEKFPKYEQYALCDQLRRAVISIPSNIAEGNGRTSVKEQIHFLEIAFGSLMEVYCQLNIASELGYISVEELKKIKDNILEISKMISGLRNSKQKTLSNP